MSMGRYLKIFRQELAKRELSELSKKIRFGESPDNQHCDFFRLSRFFRTFQELQRRRPLYVEPSDWQRAIEDGLKFLATWGEQAQALGWTERELFGLHPVPARPVANYSRLCRYDETGLIWLLRGRPVVALTATTAAILHPSGHVTTYRKRDKPALGPLGDSLEDLDAGGEQ
jgi:hypothetical protein